ncbi:MAG: alpha/beta fold hydrolase [Desulfatitalea sp.]|nr:alpha/beta fold hydrolase [Desulfatitalea sp.]NNK00778.1 alpha/beta fold hydrolase [Desulfatitalea sp.]
MKSAIHDGNFGHLYPFQSHFLKIHELRYHYLDEGRGEPLVMLHGNPTWSFYFRRLVFAFRERYRVIVPDHMGCGLSDKPGLDAYDFRLQSRIGDLDRLMRHLDPQGPITLILHDWGGMIGLGWALENLERVGRLVIMNTSGFFPPGGKQIPFRLKMIRTPNPVMSWAVLRLNLFARGAIHMATRRRMPADVRAGLLAPYNSPRNRLATLKFVQDIPLSTNDPGGSIVQSVSEQLERIGSRPTLLVWGAHDFVFGQSYYDEFRRRLPAAEAHWLPEAGHYLLEDAPEKIVDLIGTFLNKPAFR